MTVNDTIIRQATLADVDAIAANNVAMAAETEGLRLDPSTVRMGVYRVLTDDEKGRYYLAERGGRGVGQLLVTREWSDWRNDWFWWIQSVYVVPAARGAGVYRALHEYVERRARHTPGVCGLRLYVDRRNQIAREIYQHLGLQPTSYEFLQLDWAGPVASEAPPAGETTAPANDQPGLQD